MNENFENDDTKTDLVSSSSHEPILQDSKINKGLPSSAPKELTEMMKEITMMGMQKTSRGIDAFSGLDKEQKDKIIDGMHQADRNEHEFNCKKLEYSKEIEIKKIGASIVTHHTTRIILIVGITAIVLITTLILFIKPDLLSTWLAFITGLFGGGLGGYGYAKHSNNNQQLQPKSQKEE